VPTAVALKSLLVRRKPRPNTSRPAFAMFYLRVLLATTLAACPRPGTNELAFYVISPTKAVLIHESKVDQTPVVTIIEK
jgi:hypothetical protein